MQLSEAKYTGYLVKPTDHYGLSYYVKPQSFREGFSGIVQNQEWKDYALIVGSIIGATIIIGALYTFGKKTA
jgi:hypothetical protein